MLLTVLAVMATYEVSAQEGTQYSTEFRKQRSSTCQCYNLCQAMLVAEHDSVVFSASPQQCVPGCRPYGSTHRLLHGCNTSLKEH